VFFPLRLQRDLSTRTHCRSMGSGYVTLRSWGDPDLCDGANVLCSPHSTVSLLVTSLYDEKEVCLLKVLYISYS